jgi:hypothetical protein
VRNLSADRRDHLLFYREERQLRAALGGAEYYFWGQHFRFVLCPDDRSTDLRAHSADWMDLRHSARPVGFRLLYRLFHPLDHGHHQGFYRRALGIPVSNSTLEKVVSELGGLILFCNEKGRRTWPFFVRRWWGENPTPQSLRRGQLYGMDKDTTRARQSGATAASALLVGPPFGYASPCAGFEPYVVRRLE